MMVLSVHRLGFLILLVLVIGIFEFLLLPNRITGKREEALTQNHYTLEFGRKKKGCCYHRQYFLITGNFGNLVTSLFHFMWFLFF